MYNGIINVYKEAGFTSFDVVAKLRGILKQKKIGHTGTLDPDATGVLPVVVGNATKLVETLTDKKKEYVAEFVLGITTDTQDISGEVTDRRKVTCSESEIRDAIASFSGDIMQVPPMYSALKVDGKKLCDLAREGKIVERKPRPVTIHNIEILSVDMGQEPVTGIRVLCSKGTYIRTLCNDIGQKLGCGATMTKLQRTGSGRFRIEDAYRLSEIEEYIRTGRAEEIIMPVDTVFDGLPRYDVKGEEARLVSNGNQLTIPAHSDKEIRIYSEGGFIALYELKNPGQHIYKPKIMFL